MHSNNDNYRYYTLLLSTHLQSTAATVSSVNDVDQCSLIRNNNYNNKI